MAAAVEALRARRAASGAVWPIVKAKRQPSPRKATSGRPTVMPRWTRGEGGLEEGASLGMPAPDYHSVWPPASLLACANQVDELQSRWDMFQQLNWQLTKRPPQNRHGTGLATAGCVASVGARNWWVLGLGAALVVSCLSPTLPMPPPSRPEIEGPDSSGVVVLSGFAPPESWVNARNLSTNFSYGRRADAIDGSYRFPMLASVGDLISLNYRMDTEDSDALLFEIPTFTAYPRGTGGTAATGGDSGSAAGASGAAGNSSGGSAGAFAGSAGTAGSF
jgi:hypothetical protein